MYELMTLRRVNTVTFRDVEDPHYSINKITTSRNPEYSSHLRDTVRDCLIIKPWKRTRIDELRSNVKNYRDIIHKEMFSHATIRTTPPAPRPDERLYYIDNEMKDMPPGDWRPNSGEREKNPQKPDRKYRDPEIPSIPFHHFPDAVFESSQEKAKEVLSAKNKNKHILDKWSSTSRDNEEAEEGSEGGSDDDDSDDSGHPSRKRKRGDTGHNENNQSKSLGLDSRVGLHSQGSLDGSVDAGDRHHSSVEAESANEEEATGVGPESEDQSITQNRRRYRGHERRPFAVPSVTEGSGETNETSSSDDEDIEVQDEEESGVEEDAESATDEEEEETDDEDDPPAKRRSRATRFEEDSYDDGPGDVDDDEPSVTFGRRKPRAPL